MPDTIDGRFDMLVVITIVIAFRLSKINDEGKELSQKVLTSFLKI